MGSEQASATKDISHVSNALFWVRVNNKITQF